jgi:DNA-binding transcriptional LysR family regulator
LPSRSTPAFLAAEVYNLDAIKALVIGVSPDFAAERLVHPLGRFAETHSEIDLRVSATMYLWMRISADRNEG